MELTTSLGGANAFQYTLGFPATIIGEVRGSVSVANVPSTLTVGTTSTGWLAEVGGLDLKFGLSLCYHHATGRNRCAIRQHHMLEWGLHSL